MDTRIKCALCDYRSHCLVDHLVEFHNMTAEKYVETYASATVSNHFLAVRERDEKKVKRTPIPVSTALTVTMMKMTVPVDAGAAPSTALPLPDGYRFPSKGPAEKAFRRALMALIAGRNCYIWGMPGTGKDALVHVYSAMSRRPTVMVTFRPGTDLAPWFYTRSLDASGTGWEYGHLWEALVNGVEGRDGVRRAPLVLLSDVDRADSAQAEWFRILTDSISGRLLGPNGEMVNLFRDAKGNSPQFVCTANSCGSGDSRGRMTSAGPVDASIMDRLGRKIQAAYLHWDDESEVLRSKFSLVNEKAPGLLAQLGAATEALRKSIEKQDIYGEFTHRGLCDILMEAEDILRFEDEVPPNLLARSFFAWLDGLDEDNRAAARRLVDAHVKGGVLG